MNVRLLVESNAKIQVTTMDIPSRDIRSGGTYAKLEPYDDYRVKHQTFLKWPENHMEERMKNINHSRIVYL